MLNLIPVKVLYKGLFDLNVIKHINIDTTKQEGYVIRLVEQFQYDEFNKSVVKWVRKNHVTTDKHWMNNKIIPNKLK